MSLSYDLTTHVLFSLDTLSVTEFAVPPVPSTSATGMGYLGKGLGGYMTLGLGSKGRPCAINIQDSEVFLTKDSECIDRRWLSLVLTLDHRRGFILWT